jgi:uroporphyrinogen-III decarboxylase
MDDHPTAPTATLSAEVVSVDWRYGLNRCRLAMPGKVIQGNLATVAGVGGA